MSDDIEQRILEIEARQALATGPVAVGLSQARFELAASDVPWLIAELRSSRTREAEAREELANYKRTVAYQEAEYLRAHGGSWGVCQYQAENEELRAREAEARKALERIAEGRGVFSFDPLEHANNVITDAVETAKAALAGAPREDETV